MATDKTKTGTDKNVETLATIKVLERLVEEVLRNQRSQDARVEAIHRNAELLRAGLVDEDSDNAMVTQISDLVTKLAAERGASDAKHLETLTTLLSSTTEKFDSAIKRWEERELNRSKWWADTLTKVGSELWEKGGSWIVLGLVVLFLYWIQSSTGINLLGRFLGENGQ
jgi:predicted phage gp36 major capsid-like protein